LRARALLDDLNFTRTVSECVPGGSEIEAAYRVPRRITRPVSRLPSRNHLTVEISLPVTRAVNGAGTQASGIPVSFAVATVGLGPEVIAPPARPGGRCTFRRWYRMSPTCTTRR
jgi:hypothetical protein